MKRLLFIFSTVLLSAFTQANNITLTNISVINNGTNTGKIIEFDVSWENSWRVASTGNYDGAWVFFKFKDNDGKWKHLNLTGGDITMPAGTSSSFSGGTIGMLIYRTALGSGTFTATNVRAGVQSYPGVYDVRGFAIEMVYVPTGNYYLGDDTYTTGTNIFHNGSITNPFLVSSNTITFGTSLGQLQPGSGSLTASFRNGYTAHWIMKYELSQGAYRDFLNTLTYQQQQSRMPVAPSSATGTKLVSTETDISLEVITPGISNTLPAVIGCDANNNNTYDENGDGEWKVMGYLSWPDAAAYLDWAGLRPMTELEYEKACRGPISPVMNEYAWGTSAIAAVDYILVNHSNGNSSVSNTSSTDGNANVFDNRTDVNIRYYRGGIFANAGSTRISSGAGYYGAMELTGNIVELVVGATSTAGQSFAGFKGNGVLDVSGNADVNYWPGINGNNDNSIPNAVYGGTIGVTGSAGSFIRGLDVADFSVSYRPNGNNPSPYSTRNSSYGVRGAID